MSSELSEVSEQQEKDSSSSRPGDNSNNKRPHRKSGFETFDNLGLKNLQRLKPSDDSLVDPLTEIKYMKSN